MKSRDDVYHSPDWYRERCNEDYTNPIVLKMLKSDCADYYDDTSNPEELVHNYQERWDSTDFQSFYAYRMNELFLEELRTENKVYYHAMKMGYGATEETYLKIVDEIARDMLMGSDKKLILYKKRVREEAQKPLQKKQRQRMQNKFLSTKGMKAIDEDETFFTWNNPIGDQKDYKKELHYHLSFTSLMSAVEERIKMIAVEEIKTIRTIRAAHTERMKDVDKVFVGAINDGWVSRWLQIPIREQSNFVNEIEKRVEEIKKETEAQQSNEDDMKNIEAIMNKKDGKVKGLTGFE